MLGIDELYKKLPKKRYVIAGELALYETGLGVNKPDTLEVLTSHSEFKHVYISGRIYYHYVQHVDFDNYVKPHPNHPNILVPTQERALVDIILTKFDYTDEGAFCVALEQYCNNHNYELDALYEVADFYFVTRETIDYWVSECEGSIQ